MKTLEKILKKIEQLSLYQQLAFGIFVSQSLFNTYDTFVKKENWGNPAILREILQLLKNAPMHNSEFNEEIEKSNIELDAIMPNMDDFPGSIYASLALDVCSIIGECLDFVSDKNTEHIKTVSYIAIQSVEFYIADKNKIQPNIPNFEKIITNSIEMQDELSFQLKLIEFLSETIIVKEDLFERQNVKPLTLHLA